MPRLKSRLTFANVCSFLALLIALGTGSAYAANTVFSSDIVDGEVKTADLDNNSVRTTKIVNGQVANADLDADAVDGSKVLDASIAHADLANDVVNSANVSNESLTASDLATDSVNATEGVFSMTDPDHASFVTPTGFSVQLVRRDGSKLLPFCM